MQELAELAQQDNKKLEELKSAQTELERLLQEETQAKRDEEIVRALQARYTSVTITLLYLICKYFNTILFQIALFRLTLPNKA